MTDYTDAALREMKVFIVTENSWNGRTDWVVSNTGEAFFNESDAASIVAERNAKATSIYSTSYDYEEMTIR